jgi:hypothetical protein
MLDGSRIIISRLNLKTNFLCFQEDQTFPRPSQIDVPVKEQHTEVTTSSSQIDKPLHTSTKPERCKFIIRF